MTSFNTDYNNAELLDQELNFDQLQEINGGVIPFVAGAIVLGKAVATGIATFAGYKAAEKTYQAIKKAVENKAVS